MSPLQGLGQSMLFPYNSGNPSCLKPSGLNPPKAPTFAFSGYILLNINAVGVTLLLKEYIGLYHYKRHSPCKGLIMYTTISREFRKGKGIENYYYEIHKGPNTLYYEAANAEIENENLVDVKNNKILKYKIKDFKLEQNYPNPFNPATTIKYTVNKTSEVRLSVTDVLGREVALLVNEKQNAGTYSIYFYAGILPSGIYLYTISFDQARITKKMALIK
jgi:hypothetical protein